MTTKLTATITMLLRSQSRSSRELSRGLMLAYTPGSENAGTHRFTCSRRGVSPSDREMQIVEAALREALAGEGRIVVGLMCEPFLKRGRWQYHLWEWEEAEQGRLL